MAPFDFSSALRDELAQRLASHEWLQLPPEGRKHAAVVLALVPDADGRAAVILTRRSLRLKRHRGQYALPGGRVDAGETLARAGLRELHEEVGLRLEESDLLGRLDDFETRSGYLIRPLVAWGQASELRPNPGEVATIFRVPVVELGDEKALVQRRFFPGQPRVPALSLPSVGTFVFSPTAALLHQFGELAVHGRKTPVADFGQPAFTWR